MTKLLISPINDFSFENAEDNSEDNSLAFRAKFTETGKAAKNGWYFPPSAFSHVNGSPLWLVDNHDASKRVGVGVMEVNNSSAYLRGKWLSDPNSSNVHNAIKEFMNLGGTPEVSIAFYPEGEIRNKWNGTLSKAEEKMNVTLAFDKVSPTHLAVVDSGNFPDTYLRTNSQFEEGFHKSNNLDSLIAEARLEFARQLVR